MSSFTYDSPKDKCMEEILNLIDEKWSLRFIGRTDSEIHFGYGRTFGKIIFEGNGATEVNIEFSKLVKNMGYFFTIFFCVVMAYLVIVALEYLSEISVYSIIIISALISVIIITPIIVKYVNDRTQENILNLFHSRLAEL